MPCRCPPRRGRCSSPSSASTGGCDRCLESCPRSSRREPCVDTVVVAAENAAEARLVPGVRGGRGGQPGRGGDLAARRPAADAGRRPSAVPAASRSRRQAAQGQSGPGSGGGARPVRGADGGWRSAPQAGTTCRCSGPPGAGKTMLAERLPTILPRLDAAAALEVTSIHSVAGTLVPGTGLVAEPPFCAPHHTACKAAIVGGGSGLIRPGAASLAHRGVLFLDEAPEFGRDVLDALRQPLEAGRGGDRPPGDDRPVSSPVHAGPGGQPVSVRAGRPRPAGPACECCPAARRRYLGRLSGPLLDRVDVKVTLEPVNRREMLYDRKFAEPSAVVAERVAAARDRAARRLAGTPWRLNAEIPGAELRRAFPPEQGALKSLDRAMELGQVSARGADKIVRVAWSVADLAGKPGPGAGRGRRRDRAMAGGDPVSAALRRGVLRPRRAHVPRRTGRPQAGRPGPGRAERRAHSRRSRQGEFPDLASPDAAATTSHAALAGAAG